MFSKSAFAIADGMETHLCKAEGPSFKTYFSYDVENNTLKAFFLTQYSYEKLEVAHTDEDCSYIMTLLLTFLTQLPVPPVSQNTCVCQ